MSCMGQQKCVNGPLVGRLLFGAPNLTPLVAASLSAKTVKGVHGLWVLQLMSNSGVKSTEAERGLCSAPLQGRHSDQPYYNGTIMAH